MKKKLGLDLGSNSVGWALVEQDFKSKDGRILGMGSRIIPMSQDILGDFDKGNSVSQTAERTGYRATRRLRERYLLRRERLHRVLYVLGFLPEHYAKQIDFERRLGKFIKEAEPKLAYKVVEDKIKGKNEYEFVFIESFNEMLSDFREHQPQILLSEDGESRLVPYDWTIYYLRKKALTKKIKKEELAWILLNFNQKRGYYQLRGEEEEGNPNKMVEFYSLKVVDVNADEGQKGSSEIWYSLTLENGWVYRRSSKTPLSNWKGKVRDFIVTTDLNDDGTVKTDKESNEKRSFRAPGEDDWTLLKKKTERDIEQSDKTVGTYIYDTLLQNPKQKIKGKLVRTIERKFYKNELRRILQKQKEFHPELRNGDIYNDCVRELYRNNDAHRLLLSKKDFVHLLVDDIIFYQRPLRSQKLSIGNCTLEYRKYKDASGVEHTKYLKAIPKSHPYYQEFRLWQWLCNLSIYKREDDTNVTLKFLTNTSDYAKLFDFLNNRKEVDQKSLLKYFKLNEKTHRWNFVEDKKYPCNDTGYEIRRRFAKIETLPEGFLNPDIEKKIWHIIYSVTDKKEYEKALKSFANKYQVDEIQFVDAFRKVPPFKREYGAYSEKAIKKLLPLMRLGKYWCWDAIDKCSRERIEKIITGEYDENIDDRIREKARHFRDESDFQGLQHWLAQYVAYGRAAITDKWNSVDDLEQYLEDFKLHSLRNPIVEQLIMETLRVVKDIWIKYGNGVKDFFDEIHIELGREMKNTKDERKRIANQIAENENTNLRIKAILAEMVKYTEMENVRPYSPMQQEILKVYEDGVLNSDIEIDEDILKISKMAQPSSADLRKYKLWLEQRYRSPYTGAIIPLNKLFTPEYEIEHIIPQSRYFDDSFSNKVICEAAVNTLKDNQLGYEFVRHHHGEKVQIGHKTVQVFEITEYEDFIKRHYAKSRSKRNKLLMEDIPEDMVKRQMNDTRYISKFISSVLSNLVRAEANDDGINSKNLIPVNGKITNQLKQDWGLNDVWNELILLRFERMNQLTNSSNFTAWSKNHQKYLPTVPLEFSKGFSKKRIDHRHHSMDALVIACTTRDHVNLLNNKYAKSKERFDLSRKLRLFERVNYVDPRTGRRVEREVPKDFIKPWINFTSEAKTAMENIVVSFKQNLRVINKATNRYEKWVERDGVKVKEVRAQKGVNWAIRKPLHKDTVAGLVLLRRRKIVSLNAALETVNEIADRELRKEIQSMQLKGLDRKQITKYFKDIKYQWRGQDISRLEIFYWDNDNVASRVSLNDTFDEKRIGTITDTGIQKILLNHLDSCKGRLDARGKDIPAPLIAFSPEGIEEMNKNIVSLNNGRPHQPILKVRTYEPKGNKFYVGQTGNKRAKYVEAAKGTNLFFAIYQDQVGKRKYETIPLNIVIERQKQGLGSVPSENEQGDKLLFYLSPNDLVYVPSEEEKGDADNADFGDLSTPQLYNIYKVVSFTGYQIFFVKHDVAAPIVNKGEFSPLNKMERAWDGRMIKEHCIKLKVDRLGVISRFNAYIDITV
ncbi:CRISPR-associated endonuclease Csn1 [Anseongella ginsenosidimutans]|uniref:CRISPR-associated endonuclease Cas9 n=1 Tax=Anseongella ginsenosidimutans TaxID=496056 RepID=A0A4R3KMK5_9SPHI|nr:type II CRISPR RNA-guided endonuclease Cas9 [Anseongella ginsenosidimutans]QEC52783.1 type II CRISPR RNA-guided endonuclease Cas9 [Anseongella ginsenosidimutans]TCS85543.1 CRISPR-associated endonuclease Csn1 [Anseongella ginsenosidimutans]